MPYLLDVAGSKTRWSYALSWWQPEFQEINAMARPENAGLGKNAVETGYDGILIEKSAYTPEDLKSLEEHIVAAQSCRISNDDSRELFILRACQ